MGIGYSLSWKEGIIFSYAGLRGAVSLALALIVYLDKEIDNRIREVVLFQTAGVTLLLLLINANTIKFLIKKLGLMNVSEVKKKMVKNLIKAYRKEIREHVKEIRERKHFGKIDLDRLRKSARARQIRDKIFHNKKIKKEESDEIDTEEIGEIGYSINAEDYSEEELYVEVKHRYLTMLKGCYWTNFEQGQANTRSILILTESVDRALDHAEQRIKDFDFLNRYFQSTWFLKQMLKLSCIPGLKWLVTPYLQSRITFEYDTLVNYVEAHDEC